MTTVLINRPTRTTNTKPTKLPTHSNQMTISHRCTRTFQMTHQAGKFCDFFKLFNLNQDINLHGELGEPKYSLHSFPLSQSE